MTVKRKLRTDKLDIRLPPGLKQRIRDEAQKREMTLTSFVESVLRKEVDSTTL